MSKLLFDVLYNCILLLTFSLGRLLAINVEQGRENKKAAA